MPPYGGADSLSSGWSVGRASVSFRGYDIARGSAAVLRLRRRLECRGVIGGPHGLHAFAVKAVYAPVALVAADFGGRYAGLLRQSFYLFACHLHAEIVVAADVFLRLLILPVVPGVSARCSKRGRDDSRAFPI